MATTDVMPVLVLGASGFVGRELVAALCDAGENVRAGSRRSISHLPPNARWVATDLERPETLAPALADATCAYYLVHSMGEARRDFREVDRRCAENFVRAAAASNCQRIIYLGGVAPRGQPSEHLASRLEVGEILRAGRVPAVELRASMIVGSGSVSWTILRDLATRLPFMVLPQWLESRTCPIAVEDVIDALLDAREVPLETSAWFDIPGPDVLSFHEMLTIVGELRGRRIPMVRVPLLTPRLSALWLKLVTGANYEVARHLALGLRHDLLPESRRYYELSRHVPRWSFKEVAIRVLADEARGDLRAARPHPS